VSLEISSNKRPSIAAVLRAPGNVIAKRRGESADWEFAVL